MSKSSSGGKHALRLCAEHVTLGSSRMAVTGISVMTADIFSENAQTESNRMGIDGRGGSDERARPVRLI